MIAVASGKGGVGKSTTAVNLALGLRDLGLQGRAARCRHLRPVGAAADGIREKPELDGERKIIPLKRFGLTIMSIGFLVEEETAMIWRGPMVMSAMTQMLSDVAWGTLDLLVVDMPPGTGDAQLTLAQNVPLTGAVIVSTPQDLSLIDAGKGLRCSRGQRAGARHRREHELLPLPALRHAIGHLRPWRRAHEAERLGVPFLGEIPLHMAIRATSDAGNAGGGQRAGRPSCGDLPRHCGAGPGPAQRRYRRGLRPASIWGHATFVEPRHAIVAVPKPGLPC